VGEVEDVERVGDIDREGFSSNLTRLEGIVEGEEIEGEEVDREMMAVDREEVEREGLDREALSGN
jgi:hypothetical protein